MRVLHVVADHAGGSAVDTEHGLAAVALLQRARPDIPQHVQLIGGRSIARAADAMGLARAARVAPPLTRTALAWPAVHRAIRSLRPTVVHAWGAGARRAAWLAAAVTPGAAVLTTRTASTRGTPAPADLLASLEPADRTIGVALPERALDRAAVRRTLGLDDQRVALALLGELDSAEAYRVMFTAGLLWLIGHPIDIVLPTHAAQHARTLRLGRRAVHGVRVIATDLPAAAYLPACDLALWDAGGWGTVAAFDPRPACAHVPIAQAHALGVAAVAPRWAAHDALYTPAARDALTPTTAAVPETARVLRDLVRARETLPALGRALADHVRATCPAERFASLVESAWTRAAQRRGRRARPAAPPAHLLETTA